MSVQYNVATLLKEPVGSTREYEVDSRVLIDEATPRHQRVVGRTRLLRIKHGVLVISHLEGVQQDRCSRCLRGIEVRLQVGFEEEFFANVDAETATDPGPPEETGVFRIDRKHILDMEEAVRQYWMAGLPMQPLCRPDCHGLCPRCGLDLNEDTCSCEPDDDQRWSPLRQLAKQMEGK